jgi:hypothetical protein
LFQIYSLLSQDILSRNDKINNNNIHVVVEELLELLVDEVDPQLFERVELERRFFFGFE